MKFVALSVFIIVLYLDQLNAELRRDDKVPEKQFLLFKINTENVIYI